MIFCAHHTKPEKRTDMKNSEQGSSRSLLSDSSTSNKATHMLIPGLMGFMSAHALINKERIQRGCESLNRSTYLDRLCQLQAEFMAEQGELSHTSDTTTELKDLVHSESAGENIQRGPSVELMHKDAMKSKRTAFKNILNKKFAEFGVGTAQGKDGKLYMVQLFRGIARPENEIVICQQ